MTGGESVERGRSRNLKILGAEGQPRARPEPRGHALGLGHTDFKARRFQSEIAPQELFGRRDERQNVCRLRRRCRGRSLRQG